MDNNDNNNSSKFVAYEYDEDPFDIPVLIDNFIEPDPALVYLGFDKSQKPRQNDPIGAEQGRAYSITDSTILQDEYSMNRIEVPETNNCQVVAKGSTSKLKRKYPWDTEDIEDESMNNINNDYPNGGGLLNNLSEPGPSNQMAPRDWPLMPRPFFCTSCQMLRHIIHTNGTDFEQLEIHGRIGLINHIIIQNQSITPDGAGPSCGTYDMINFNNGSTTEVKCFLQDYCATKDALGYIIVEDTFAAFYEVVCTGYDWVVKRPSSEEDDLILTNVEEEHESESCSKRRPGQKSRKEQQSKRIQSMTLNDLSGVFHITMSKASSKNELDMSVTAIKSICRRFKLFKWPQRQLQPLARKMKVLKRALESSQDPLTIQTTRMEVRRIKQEMTKLCGGVTPTGIEIPEIEE